MRYLTFLFTFLLLALLASCSRDEGIFPIDGPETGGPTPVVEIPKPLPTTNPRTNPDNPNKDVSFPGFTDRDITPNPDGSFTIPNDILDPNGTAITITKPGHWPEHRRYVPAGDGEIREMPKMEPKVKAGDINPSTGGTINLGEGFSVTLSPNTVATTEDGQPYEGEVSVFVNHDAPEDANEMLNSASNFLARTADGSEAVLESYGMMDIALEDPNGNPLVLDGSTPAEVRMPLKAATQAIGPDEVDFWVLDPDGFWLPAGVATLAPDCYVVYITTPGTYNVDIPHPVTRICGRFVDPNGLPLTHSPFLVSLDGGMSCTASLVDCDGEFCVDVAADVPLFFNVTDPCTEETFIFAIEPIDENTLREIGDIVVDLSNPVFMSVVRSCDGTQLPNIAATEIWVGGNGGNGGEYWAPDENGSTVVNVVECGLDEIIIQAFTNDYRAASRLIRRSVEEDMPEEFIVCGDLSAEEYFNMTIDGVNIPIKELVPIYWPDNGNFDWQVRAAGVLDGEEYSIFLRFADPTEGPYAAADASAAIYRLAAGQDYGEGRVYVDPAENIGLQGVAFDEELMTFEGAFTVLMNLQNDANRTVEATNVVVQVDFKLAL